MKEIHSSHNATYKVLKSLLTHKGRSKHQRFIMEGNRHILSSAENGLLPVELYYTSAVVDDLRTPESALYKIHGYFQKVGIPQYLLNSELFEEISDTEQSQGLFAVYEIKRSVGKDGLSRGHDEGVIVVLDQIRDPGNMGTILRTADGAGIKQIIAVKGTVDAYAQKVVRSTAGSILNVDIDYMEREQAIERLGSLGYHILCADLKNAEDYKMYFSVLDKRKIPLIALVMGNESVGVSEDFLKASHASVKIPIYGGAESLNVAVAAGILMYELRHRLNEMYMCGNHKRQYNKK